MACGRVERKQARSLVRSRGCNNVYIRRLAGREAKGRSSRDRGLQLRRDSGRFSSRGSAAETPDPKYKMLIAKPGDVYQIQPGLSPLSRYTERGFLPGGLSFFPSPPPPSLSLSRARSFQHSASSLRSSSSSSSLSSAKSLNIQSRSREER